MKFSFLSILSSDNIWNSNGKFVTKIGNVCYSKDSVFGSEPPLSGMVKGLG
jgi:hypothetical protein